MDTFFENGHRPETTQPQPLNMDNVSGALAILAVGLVFSTMVCVLEYFIDKTRVK